MNIPSPSVLKSLGRRMPRRKGQHGQLKRVGRDKWWCRWYRYEGNRRKPKTLTFDGFTGKVEAQRYLDGLILESLAAPALTPAASFADLWQQYCAFKSGKWTTGTRKSVESTFNVCVLPRIGHLQLSELTPGPLQGLLNLLARENYSGTVVRKVRAYFKAALEFALDEDLIRKNPAKRLDMPTIAAKKSERFYTLDEVRRLLAAAGPREHLILRLFLVGGFRSGELFALRRDDVETGSIRVDETWKRFEKGNKRYGTPKTPASSANVPIPADLERELKEWIQNKCGDCIIPAILRCPARVAETGIRELSASKLSHGDGNSTFLFMGPRSPLRPDDYRKNVLQPLARSVGIPDLTYQALRRTCATWFRNDLKSAQAQLRHTNPHMTAGTYQKTISADQRAAVESLDALFTGREKGTIQ